MIQFLIPKLTKMHSGRLSLQLTEKGAWESFPAFAEALANQLGGEITERVNAPDIRLWTLHYSGNFFHLVYEDYPNGVSLEPTMDTQDEMILALFAMFTPKSTQ